MILTGPLLDCGLKPGPGGKFFWTQHTTPGLKWSSTWNLSSEEISYKYRNPINIQSFYTTKWSEMVKYIHMKFWNWEVIFVNTYILVINQHHRYT